VKVVDASVLVLACTDDGPSGADALRALRGRRIIAPAMVDLEVMSAVRKLLARGFDAARARAGIAWFMAMPIRREPHPPLLPRIWSLRHNLTPYDAAYVALAEALDVPLLTADRRMTQAPGATCRFELISPSTQG
jgi:predicted nucleic acid-binding protein